MSATATLATRLPAGTWKVDPTHSSATFAVKHMAVGTFRGGFENLDAALIVSDDGAATLQGTVCADSITVKDENLRAHLGSPDFFDIERHPELSFRSDSLQPSDDGLLWRASSRSRATRTPCKPTAASAARASGSTARRGSD